MRLDRQQKITALIFGIMIVLAVGTFVFMSLDPHETKTLQIHPTFSTSTPKSDLSSNGWWDSIPLQGTFPTAKPVPLLSNERAATPTKNPSP